MTNDEINIAIAEYHNWRNIKEIDYQPFGTDPYIDGPDQMWVGIHPESDSDSDEYEVIPDYCNDLNLIRQSELTLWRDECLVEKYEENLKKEFLYQVGYQGAAYWFMANARTKAVAFLKTIGKM